ncbi:MAG: tetratricopeptide repeat protein [Deltaproteobacteria bacterium]|jgi:tetratricopeptide (TPR) repeat protein|nr:tetratricopeptide repeat protein [Deltaproteobacteria bacterium]
MRRSIRLAVCFAALLAATASAESLEELLARSEAIYATGRFEEAIAILQARLEAPEPDDNLIPVRGTLGDIYLEMAKPDKALEQFDEIAAEHPRYARAHYKRGRALEQLARFLEAIDAYALAGEQLYDEAEIRGRIGFNYSLLANLPETATADRRRYAELARKSLTRAIQLDPSNLSAMGNLADIHFNLGEFQLALDYYERMDRMESSRPMTLARIGSAYLKLEQCKPAVENLLRAAEILAASKPRTRTDAQVHRDVEVFARVRAAECLIALDRAAEARSQISRVLEIANCTDCATASREVDRSKLRAEELLLQLDAVSAANAEATR